MPIVDIIIVAWNAAAYLPKCLNSLQRAVSSDIQIGSVILVDNGTGDEWSVEAEGLGLNLMVIKNDENRGFAAACNQGAALSEADYLLFLNPDTVLPEGSLCSPVGFMEEPQNSSVGIVGIQMVEDTGRVARSCARYPTPGRFLAQACGLQRLFPSLGLGVKMTEWAHDETRHVDHVIGAFYLVRMYTWEEVGAFDERFFVYLEDVDYSYRANRAGWSCVYLTTASAYHRGGGTTNRIRGKRLFYSLRSRVIYAHKHFGWIAATVVTLATLLLEPLIRVGWAMTHLSAREVLHTIQGYSLLYRASPVLLRSVWRRKRDERPSAKPI